MIKNTTTYKVLQSWVDSHCNSGFGNVTASISAEVLYAKESDGAAVLELETRENTRLEIWVGAADEKGAHSLITDDGTGGKFIYTARRGPKGLRAELDRIAARLFADAEASLAA